MSAGRRRLGALVVGQSPRPDVEAEIRAAIGDAIELDLRGCLDGLSRAEIDAIPPRDGADALFTRLPDGDGVRISKTAAIAHGEAQLSALAAAGFDVAMVLCTGSFADWSRRHRVVFPSRIMAALAGALLPSNGAGRLGVFAPLAEQVPSMRDRWRAAGFDAEVVALSPNADDDAAGAAAEAMARAAPDLLAFDCISYTGATKRTVCAALRRPGILAISAAARCAAELAG